MIASVLASVLLLFHSFSPPSLLSLSLPFNRPLYTLILSVSLSPPLSLALSAFSNSRLFYWYLPQNTCIFDMDTYFAPPPRLPHPLLTSSYPDVRRSPLPSKLHTMPPSPPPPPCLLHTTTHTQFPSPFLPTTTKKQKLKKITHLCTTADGKLLMQKNMPASCVSHNPHTHTHTHTHPSQHPFLRPLNLLLMGQRTPPPFLPPPPDSLFTTLAPPPHSKTPKGLAGPLAHSSVLSLHTSLSLFLSYSLPPRSQSPLRLFYLESHASAHTHKQTHTHTHTHTHTNKRR